MLCVVLCVVLFVYSFSGIMRLASFFLIQKQYDK